MEQPETTTEVQPAQKIKKDRKNMMWPLIAVLLLLAGLGAYYYRDNQAKNQHKTDTATITKLQADLKTANAKTAAAETTTTTTPTESETATVPTAAVKENVIASIKSGNTAALEGYMASTVSVIIAASEGVGNRTPAQAVSDLAYLDGGTDPWDFSLAAATLTGYQTGDYATYFKSNSVVGKSANGYVVSFNFDTAGKINGVFMSVSDDLL
jgi:Tfp pilus assembly major pilin PilA